MDVTLISDTHNRHRDIGDLGGGDLIIHAGDATSRGRPHEIKQFLVWYGALPFDKKILVPGNHDFGFEDNPEDCRALCNRYNVTLLLDSGVSHRGLHIWGSPVQPYYGGWAFNRRESGRSPEGDADIQPHWDKIPDCTDILITHSPPLGILDQTQHGVAAGSKSLLEAIQRVRPMLHVFGHIHEARGMFYRGGTLHVNASMLDGVYQPVRVPAFTLTVGGF